MEERTNGLLIGGIALLALGKFMDLWFPINKNLWSSSYVVFTAGAALLLLGICYWTIDVKGYRKWAKPFIVFGSNAIAVFVASGMLADILNVIKLNGADGKQTTLKNYIYTNLFVSWAGEMNGSLAFAIFYILFWLAPMWMLYRKKIFIKV